MHGGRALPTDPDETRAHDAPGLPSRPPAAVVSPPAAGPDEGPAAATAPPAPTAPSAPTAPTAPTAPPAATGRWRTRTVAAGAPTPGLADDLLGTGTHPDTDAAGPVTGDVLVTDQVDVQARRHRGLRLLSLASALVGTLGLLAALVLAVVAARYVNVAGDCLAYAAAHVGARGFACSHGAHVAAVVLPLVVLPLAVLVGLGLAWVPEHTPRRRGIVLVGLLAVEVAVCVALALVVRASP